MPRPKLADALRMRTWRSTDRGEIVLIGGGGHAVVVAETARLLGWTIAGLLDDDETPPAAHAFNTPRLGALHDVPQIASRAWILAIGDLARRAALLQRIDLPPAPALIHPRALVSPAAEVAHGTWVGPGAVINTLARIGPHAIINSGAIVEHECTIGANAHIAPGAVLGGRVTVGDAALVGLGSRILPGIQVGAGSVVGAGAVVIADVPDATTVIGVPARPAPTP